MIHAVWHELQSRAACPRRCPAAAVSVVPPATPHAARISVSATAATQVIVTSARRRRRSSRVGRTCPVSMSASQPDRVLPGAARLIGDAAADLQRARRNPGEMSE
jgi:hypothetical protein